MLLGNSILRIPVHCTYAKWPYVFHNNSNIRKLTSLVIFLALSLCFHNTVFHSTPSVWVELGGGGGGGGGDNVWTGEEDVLMLNLQCQVRDQLPHLKAIVQYKGKLSQQHPNVLEVS